MSASGLVVTSSKHDMFCPGTAMLPEGVVMVNGGGVNVASTSLYTASNAFWAANAPMTQKRWYNSSVTLSDGSVFTLAGNRRGGFVSDGSGERWRGGRGWKGVPGARLEPVLTPVAGNRAMEHVRLLVAPNGRLLYAGPHPDMVWYDPLGEGAWTPAGRRSDDAFSQNAITALYDVGKILKAGGNPIYGGAAGTASLDSAYVLDLNGPNVITRKVAPLAHARAYANAVVLPTGEVLVTGGISNNATFTDVGAVKTPEIFDPVTETWRDTAPMTTPRTYHSVAVLMPDARVFAGGGGQCGTCAYNHFDAEIFSPYYLFQGARPQLLTAPRRAVYGGTVQVTASGTLTHFAWIRLSSVTHSVNTDQRYLKPAFTALGGGAYSVSAPANSSEAPPGVYMLFALDGVVPSVAKLVRIDERNLALGRPAKQSSNWSTASPASKAVDGATPDVAPTNYSHTTSQAGAWWQVDLGAVTNIGRVHVWNRGSCCAERASNFDVKLSSNGTTWTSVLHVAESASFPTVLDFAGAPGRYVRVQLRGTNYLHLGEVEVFPAPTAPGGLKNLALGGVATQSSEYPTTSYPASRAIDGLTPDAHASNFTHTATEAKPWWQVDLRAPSPIGRVNVWSRNCCRERLQNVEVSLSDDGVTWRETMTVPGILGMPSTLDFGGLVARFVRVQLPSTGPLHLGEVEVFPPFAGLANLARGKPATQSSTFEAYSASLAADGVTPPLVPGNFSHTTQEANPWWQVDLESPQVIGQVAVWNRAGNTRLRDFTISLSEDGVTWSTVKSFPGVAPALTTADFEGATARFVRVQMNATEYLHLGEVEVYPPR